MPTTSVFSSFFVPAGAGVLLSLTVKSDAGPGRAVDREQRARVLDEHVLP